MMMWLFAYTTIDVAEESKFYGSPFLLGSVFVVIATVIFAVATKRKKQ
jgi:hypothetical protein